jgi:hypothetical protein
MPKMPTKLTYTRPDKLDHADTVLYEIYMLRFATQRLVESNWKDPKDAWVYLEAFLVHYRNLIEFLGNQNPRPTDLHVTTIWALAKLDPPARLKEIHAKGTQLLDEYEPKDAQGGGRISQYLQHCTTKRIECKDWRIDTMSNAIEPLLEEVEHRLRPSSWVAPVPAVPIQGYFAASSTTATITSAAAFNPERFSDDVERQRKWPRR